MATGKITQKETIDNKVITTFEDLNKELERSIRLVIQLTKESIDLAKSLNPNDIQAVANAQKEYNDIAAKSQEENKKAATNLDRLRQKIKEVNEEEEKAKIALQEKRAEIKKKIKAEQDSKKSTENLTQVLKQNVKSEKEATEQNKKLIALRKQLDVTTAKGAKSVSLINKTIDKNNELLKNNASTLGKQKMNIGAYKESITEALSEQEFFGISINKISASFKSGAGIIGAVVAVVAGLGKAYASSARGAEDMARASDRLHSITKSLGNSLADATGEVGFFDALVRGLQQQILGISKTMESDMQVAILSTIRQLEIMDADQERQKKNQLNRAEELRQIRDEERNSLEDRKKANEELGNVINEREAETVAHQEKILANLQTLLKFNEGDLELQRQIKQVEFEIADAREEAQGFRSEQLINDLALSREYLQNELELQQLIIQGEINSNAESYNLKKQLIDTTLKLEYEAAGENEQLRQIALQKAKNAEEQLTSAIFAEHDKRNERFLLEMENKSIAREESVDTEIENFDADLEREIEQQEQMTDVEIEAINKRTEAQIEADKAKKESVSGYIAYATQSAQTLSNSIMGYLTADLEMQQKIDTDRAKSRGASQAEIDAIELKYAKKKKNIALTQAIINTALGVTSALANSGNPILGIIMAALVGVAGALEIATISSQKFAKGTKDSGAKWIDATVGEIGTERINFADGTSMYTPQTSTRMLLPPHSEVVPNIELQRELAEIQNIGKVKRESNKEQKEDYKELIKAIKKRDETYINITENGVSVTAKRGNDFYKYIDRTYRS